MTDPTLVSITPELYESLSLLVEDARVQLPEELRRAIAESLEQYLPDIGEVGQDNTADRGLTDHEEKSSTLKEKPGDEPSSGNGNVDKAEATTIESTAYIPHSILLNLSQWTRHPKTSRTLHRLGIGRSCQSMNWT